MEFLIFLFGSLGIYVAYITYTGNKPKPKQKTLADYGIHVNQPQTQTTTRNESKKEYFAWPPLMEFDFEVVGESHYQDAIEKIAKLQEAKYTNNPDAEIQELTAYLIPDDNNPYDDKAVRIDIDGMQVGHLSREDARSFRRRLGAKKLTGQITTCGAKLIGGYVKDGKQLSYGVVLDIKPFE